MCAYNKLDTIPDVGDTAVSWVRLLLPRSIHWLKQVNMLSNSGSCDKMLGERFGKGHCGMPWKETSPVSDVRKQAPELGRC